VYCDISLRDFSGDLPAAGAINAGVRIASDRLARLANARWVDIMQASTGATAVHAAALWNGP